MNLEVICLETDAFYDLVDKVVDKMMAERKEQAEWLSVDEAMNLLKITSRTTLQKLKNEGHVKFTQPMKKLTLFSRKSILAYLEKHSKESFK